MNLSNMSRQGIQLELALETCTAPMNVCSKLSREEQEYTRYTCYKFEWVRHCLWAVPYVALCYTWKVEKMHLIHQTLVSYLKQASVDYAYIIAVIARYLYKHNKSHWAYKIKIVCGIHIYKYVTSFNSENGVVYYYLIAKVLILFVKNYLSIKL